MSLDVASIRAQFPALETTVHGYPAVFFDGPGGTQTPQRVIDRMVEYLVRHNANTHGAFLTSVRSDEVLFNARNTFASYFKCSWDEVAFCHNSTTISFKLAQAIARDLKPGDEVIITDLDHEANRGPWEVLVERGIVVNSVRMHPETCALDMEDFQAKLTNRAKVVAFNMASNAVGTISDAKAIIRMARQAGAITIADAVHYAPHAVIDARELDLDFLFCSAYKFFGPHLGVLYAKREAMEKLRTLKVSAQQDQAPYRFETGTLNHEGIAGAAEAVEFIAEIGAAIRNQPVTQPIECSERRKNIVAGITAAEEYEKPLAEYFKDQLRQIKGLKLYGPPKDHPCTSTISFTLQGVPPKKIATLLGDKGIFTWNGNFYAVHVIRTLGLAETGGLLRIGLAPYNTKEEIDRTLEEIQKIATAKHE